MLSLPTSPVEANVNVAAPNRDRTTEKFIPRRDIFFGQESLTIRSTFQASRSRDGIPAATFDLLGTGDRALSLVCFAAGERP
jgi:hypothetical protein